MASYLRGKIIWMTVDVPSEGSGMTFFKYLKEETSKSDSIMWKFSSEMKRKPRHSQVEETQNLLAADLP